MCDDPLAKFYSAEELLRLRVKAFCAGVVVGALPAVLVFFLR
jgi:hypothetical protein